MVARYVELDIILTFKVGANGRQFAAGSNQEDSCLLVIVRALHRRAKTGWKQNNICTETRRARFILRSPGSPKLSGMTYGSDAQLARILEQTDLRCFAN